MMCIRSCLSLVLIAVAGPNPVKVNPFMPGEVGPGPWFFSLASTEYSTLEGVSIGSRVLPNESFVEGLLEGQILVERSDPNAMLLELTIERLRPVGDRSLPSEIKERYAKILPFISRVTLSPQSNGPIKMQIVKGAADPNGKSGAARPLLNVQYQLIYLILDMMGLGAKSTEEVGTSDRCGWVTTMTERSQLETDRLGSLTLGDLRSFRCPSQFCVVPVFEGKAMKGLQFSSLYHYQNDVRYYSRILDSKVGFVVHSVNLEAAAKKKTGGGSFQEMTAILNDPMQFRSYHLSEFSITDKPAGSK